MGVLAQRDWLSSCLAIPFPAGPNSTCGEALRRDILSRASVAAAGTIEGSASGRYFRFFVLVLCVSAAVEHHRTHKILVQYTIVLTLCVLVGYI